jgi:hypothetical protein
MEPKTVYNAVERRFSAQPKKGLDDEEKGKVLMRSPLTSTAKVPEGKSARVGPSKADPKGKANR